MFPGTGVSRPLSSTRFIPSFHVCWENSRLQILLDTQILLYTVRFWQKIPYRGRRRWSYLPNSPRVGEMWELGVCQWWDGVYTNHQVIRRPQSNWDFPPELVSDYRWSARMRVPYYHWTSSMWQRRLPVHESCYCMIFQFDYFNPGHSWGCLLNTKKTWSIDRTLEMRWPGVGVTKVKECNLRISRTVTHYHTYYLDTSISSRFHGGGVVETKEHTIQKCSSCCWSPIRLDHPNFLVGIKHTHDLLGCVTVCEWGSWLQRPWEREDDGERGDGKCFYCNR